VALTFEWDAAKATENSIKHGVSFEEASTCFSDLEALVVFDPDHSKEEDRYVLLGMSSEGRLLVVVHTDRSDIIRIINARLANRRETAKYS
jgi:uncharacterized DUF497 family protein